METLIDLFGENQTMLAFGFGVGAFFGICAYLSRFCLRAATIELAEGTLGPKLAIWLTAFCSALIAVQSAIWLERLDVGSARQLATTGSMSGAILGGLIFGSGMVLARGCVSRLLVLSASGNLRAIVTGLVVTLVAQASLRGVLAPTRETLAALWTVPGGVDRALAFPEAFVVASGVIALIGAVWLGLKRGATPISLAAACGVGLAVFAGWALTATLAAASFEIVAVQSATFTGPSTDTLMALVNTREFTPSFGLGLVPGVFLGAMTVAWRRGELRVQRFEPDVPMERYITGGCLMGFGSMLAGGCAVGAGLSGGAILASTAWVAVFCMWLGSVTTHLLLTRRSFAARA